MQDVEALTAVILPLGQFRHAGAPLESVYLPTAHAKHTEAPKLLVYPASHKVQFVVWTRLVKVPGAQSWQIEAPSNE